MLDRRSLLVAGASSLASIMLSRVPGSANAFILPFAPTEAYADKKDPFRVLVLSRTMFGVVVVDVANKNTPIAGAQVTLTSRYAAGKQLTATTDDEGTAIFEVAPLSEGYVDEATLLDAYDFNGGISISTAGYRDVEIPLARIQGGTAITAPTRPLDSRRRWWLEWRRYRRGRRLRRKQLRQRQGPRQQQALRKSGRACGHGRCQRSPYGSRCSTRRGRRRPRRLQRPPYGARHRHRQ